MSAKILSYQFLKMNLKMSEAIFDQIKRLVVDQMGNYKKPFTRQTAIEADLGITGDDAVEFLSEFGRRFNVDLSGFKIRQYFLPEGDTILPALIRVFTGKEQDKKKELTLGDLERAVLAGRLDGETLSSP